MENKFISCDTEAPVLVVEIEEEDKKVPDRGDEKVPDATISRRLQIKNDKGEYSIEMMVIVEDFRAGFYVAFLLVMIVGWVLTKAFTKEDIDIYITQVYGESNACTVLDFPPATYVLPALWCIPMFLGFMYSIAAIFRIHVSYLEMKLSRCAQVMLITIYVYVILTLVCFSIIFAVQPDPKDPVTMIIHSIPYSNLKWMFGMLQIAIVYFGAKVSWVGLNFPRWFLIGSIIHAILLIVVNIGATVIIFNALGNMGAGMEGKGLWWSVRSEGSKLSGNILVNYLGMLLGVILPLFQTLYICRKGTNTHSLLVAVSDNRVSAYHETNNNDDDSL